jgi:hypothetical protein
MIYRVFQSPKFETIEKSLDLVYMQKCEPYQNATWAFLGYFLNMSFMLGGIYQPIVLCQMDALSMANVMACMLVWWRNQHWT